MLHESDDARIHQVAQGLVMLVGCSGAVTELTRLYGRDRAIEVMRRTALAGRVIPRFDEVEIVIDLIDVEPATPSVTLDLRGEQAPMTTRPTQPGRTHWL